MYAWGLPGSVDSGVAAFDTDARVPTRRAMGHPNEDLLRRAYGLRDRAEVDPLRSWLHDDVVWHSEDRDLHGPAQVMAMLAEADEMAGRSQSHDVHAILADDDYGMVFNTVRAERIDGDLYYEDRHVDVYRFSNGRIIEYWGFFGDSQAAEDFWT
jgi:limonene-1,2-epoxide hydrolase